MLGNHKHKIWECSPGEGQNESEKNTLEASAASEMFHCFLKPEVNITKC